MSLAAVVLATSLVAAQPAQAAPAKSPPPGSLGIKGVTVDVQPKSLVEPAPPGAHIEAPPFGGIRAFRVTPSASPSVPPKSRR